MNEPTKIPLEDKDPLSDIDRFIEHTKTQNDALKKMLNYFEKRSKPKKGDKNNQNLPDGEK
jgi:hypothetical protein